MPSEEGWAKIGHVGFVTAGCFCFVSCVTSFASMYAHLSNYRRPNIQRIILRIFWMVPIYAFSSWMSLLNRHASDYIDTVRDLYEAFVIYAFFNLLVAYLGGERQLLVGIQGRPPTKHMFPVNLFRADLDMGDPKVFLAVRRGVLQFVLLKPVFSILTLLLKQSDNYSEGFISLTSSYVWLTLLYNISVSASMYCLLIFYFTCEKDLKPYRPVPKFLCIKAVILFAFYQGVIISVLVWTGVIKEKGDYSTDNISQALQDFLISFEMMFAAAGHVYAFSHKDYIPTPKANVGARHDWTDLEREQLDSTPVSGRLPFRYALRDALGVKDIVIDFRHTIKGTTFKTLTAAESLIERLSDNHRSSLERFLYRRFGIRRRFHRSGRVVTIHGPGYYTSDSPSRAPQPAGATTSESVGLLADEHERRYSYRSFSDETGGIPGDPIAPPLLPGRSVTNDPFNNDYYYTENGDDNTSEISLTFREDRELETLYDQTIMNFPDGDYQYPVIPDEPPHRSLAGVQRRLRPEQQLESTSFARNRHSQARHATQSGGGGSSSRPGGVNGASQHYQSQHDHDDYEDSIDGAYSTHTDSPFERMYESFGEKLPDVDEYEGSSSQPTSPIRVKSPRSPGSKKSPLADDTQHQSGRRWSQSSAARPPRPQHPYISTTLHNAPLVTADAIKRKPEPGPPIIEYGPEQEHDAGNNAVSSNGRESRNSSSRHLLDIDDNL